MLARLMFPLEGEQGGGQEGRRKSLPPPPLTLTKTSLPIKEAPGTDCIPRPKNRLWCWPHLSMPT